MWDPKDEFGRDRAPEGEWWHAVDLCSDHHWQGLLETRRFTTPTYIAQAVAFHLEISASSEGRGKKRPSLSIEHARSILAELGIKEPADRSRRQLLGRGIQPAHIVEKHPRTGKTTSESWPINVMRGPGAAWLVVHGIEDGWFARTRAGYLEMSPEGRRRRKMDAKEKAPPARAGE